MGLYVTLYSDKNDSLGTFNTNLHKAIQLNGSYEVALVEISYPITWKASLGSVIVQDKLVDINIETINLGRVNDYSNGYQIANQIKYGFKQSVTSKIAKLNAVYQPNSREIYITLNNIDLKNVKINKKMLVIDEKFAETFKISQSSEQFDNKYIHNAGTLEEIPHLNIYCDIITNQYDGDTKSKLLRSIKVNGYAKQIVHETYTTPHYCVINKSNIDSIEISIKDQYKRPVIFESGIVIIKLHIRKQE